MEKLKHHMGVHHINSLSKFILVSVILALGIFGIAYSVRAYPEVFRTNIIIQKAVDISPQEDVVINFSVPVFVEEYGSNIEISPKVNFKLRWENSNKKLTIISESFWKPGTNYQIILPRGRNIMFSQVDTQTIAFSTQDYPSVLNFFPENSAKDVLIGMEDPISVSFDKSTKDFSVKFVLNPTQELSFQVDKDKKQFKLLPKNVLADATRYNLKVYIKYTGESESDYREIYESFFETPPPPKIIWEKDYVLRLDQARRFGRAKIKTGKYIDINLSAQIMSIFEEGKIVDAFLISSGKRGMDTPKIETKIYNKFPRAFSKAYGLFMPRWMALVPDGKFGIHELPEWPGGYKEGANHLGIPVSHGCVRLGVGPAERVYDFASIGTPVVIY